MTSRYAEPVYGKHIASVGFIAGIGIGLVKTDQAKPHLVQQCDDLLRRKNYPLPRGFRLAIQSNLSSPSLIGLLGPPCSP